MQLHTTALCAALALGGLAAAHADTLAKVRDSGRITLAYRESSVPFSYLDNGKPIGMTVEMSQAVAEAVAGGVAVGQRQPLLANGTIDLECGSTTNNTVRGKEVAFAINHFYTGTRLLVKKSSGIKNYADLKDKTVAITTGTTNLQVLRKANADKAWGMNIVMAKDHADGFLLVENDRAAAFGMDDILLFGLIPTAKNPGDFEVVADSLQVEPYACMLRKDDAQFKQLVDGVIGDMMKSGAFARLYDKWFMQPIAPRNVALGLPMSEQLQKNLQDLSDKPAF